MTHGAEATVLPQERPCGAVCLGCLITVCINPPGWPGVAFVARSLQRRAPATTLCHPERSAGSLAEGSRRWERQDTGEANFGMVAWRLLRIPFRCEPLRAIRRV